MTTLLDTIQSNSVSIGGYEDINAGINDLVISNTAIVISQTNPLMIVDGSSKRAITIYNNDTSISTVLDKNSLNIGGDITNVDTTQNPYVKMGLLDASGNSCSATLQCLNDTGVKSELRLIDYPESILTSIKVNTSGVSSDTNIDISGAGVTFGGNAGDAGWVLTSNGAGNCPTFQASVGGFASYSSVVSSTAGTILFSSFSPPITPTTTPVIILTSTSGTSGVCIPISVATVDIIAGSFTWAATSTITFISAIAII